MLVVFTIAVIVLSRCVFCFVLLSVWLPLATEHRHHCREHNSRHRDHPFSQLSAADDDDAVWAGANGEEQWIDDGRDSLPFEVRPLTLRL